MKKIFLYVMCIAALGFNSCSDFLNLRPGGSIDEAALLDYDGVQKVITSMYSNLNNSSNTSTIVNYQYGDVLGGSANKGSNFADQPDFTNFEVFTILSDNSYFRSKWSSVYNGVFRANTVLSMSNKLEKEFSDIPGEEKNFYIEAQAQAMFMRGFWHFEAVKIFGAGIPYISLEDYESAADPRVSNVDDAGNYIYIWDKIEADLEFAYNNLPDTWAKERGRINKWTAAALWAKVKVFRSSPYNGTNGTTPNWGGVKSLLETIMASGKDNAGNKFKLANTVEELWVAGKSDWTGESVFDVQQAIMGTQTETNGYAGPTYVGMSGALGNSGYGFYQPSYEMVQSHIVDANGLPMLNGAYRDQAPLSTFDGSLVLTDLAVYTDPRVDISIGRFQTPYWDWTILKSVDGWIREAANGGPYIHKKYIPKKADKGSLSVATSAASTAKNVHMIRFAEILLWYAEALIETGDHQAAGQYINQVRARAANWYLGAANDDLTPGTSSYVLDDKVNGKTSANAAGNYRIGLWPESQFATKESATAALRFERKIELALEGHRWFDLCRWGIVGAELNSYVAYEKQYLRKFESSVYGNNWISLPIPQREINTMQGVLVQSVNWK